MAQDIEMAGGYISDDSSFYGTGDETVRQDYERRSDRILEFEFEPPFPREAFTRVDGVPTSNVPLKRNSKIQRELARHIHGKSTPDLVEIDRDRGNPSAWYPKDESIDAFLRRLPIADPATTEVGPWLWVHSPTLPWAQAHRKPADMAPFAPDGTARDLLHAFDVQQATIESQNPGKEPVTITKKLGPYRDKLEIDLLTIAVQNRVTCGKWMFFPAEEDLPRFWRLIATATSEGKLGPTSKVGTYDPTQKHTLICVYTYDFSDTEDVIRVLNELSDLGLLAANGKPIYYKCDAYTYLDITSQNRFRLRASLYSSKDLLQDKAKVLKDGTIARLKKRNQRSEEFDELFSGEDIS